MHIAFITVGNPQRFTGGYLYHREVFTRLRARGFIVDEIVASAADLQAQIASAAVFGRDFDPQRYDCILVDGLARAVVAPWLDTWRVQRPLLAMIHELPSVANDAPEEHEREAPLLRVDRLIAVSDDGAAILVQRGVPRERIRIIAPGCDRLAAMIQTRRAHGAGSAQSAALFHTHRGRRVICVAQWIARKDILGLVRAWSMRPRQALLELIGETDADPAYRAEVEAAIASAAAHIVVRDAVSEDALATAFAHAYFFALPARYEGYGMAFAEALACGLPIVACAVGPLPGLIGDAGLLVPPGDTAALDRALTRLLGDNTLYARLRAKALHRGLQLPTWDDTAAAFATTLHAAL
jgi:glycosyltransferase involved in cell wall biosynthesis